jgi:thiol-disulfide isomerase/thioredoxin
MKKLIAILMVLAGFFVSQPTLEAQEVEREYVVLEIATGTWCGYCPGAAMGADELVENGHDVAVVEYHGGDIYETSDGSARISYYGVTGYPTAIFDGVDDMSGGSATSSLYGSYLPMYEARKAIPSAFTIDVDGACASQSVLDLNITVNKVADYANDNLRVHAVVTESHIPDAWGGLPTVDFVQRIMMPNHQGTTVDFSSSDEQEVSVSCTLDNEWVYENLELVVFVQDNSTKEILQGFKAPVSDYTANFDNDVSLVSIDGYASQNCSGVVAPTVKVLNFGTENLTSLTVEYVVNGGAVNTHEWTGDVANLETAVIDLPEVAVEVQENNIIEVELLNPNGVEDEYEANNTSSVNFTEAAHATSVILILRTDNNPEETSWELVDGEGNVIDSGDSYTASSTFVLPMVEVPLEGPDCVTFHLYDAGGDGITDGDGVLNILDQDENLIYDGTNVNFGSHLQVDITVDDNTAVENYDNNFDLSIYPNPASTETKVAFNLTQNAETSVQILDAYGKVVFDYNLGNMNSGNVEFSVDTEKYAAGVYFVRLRAGNETYSERLIIK